MAKKSEDQAEAEKKKSLEEIEAKLRKEAAEKEKGGKLPETPPKGEPVLKKDPPLPGRRIKCEGEPLASNIREGDVWISSEGEKVYHKGKWVTPEPLNG